MVVKTLITALFLISSLAAYTQIPEKPEDISPLLVGEKIPTELFLYNSSNEAKPIEEIFNKSTVLIFYRGGWCPYCNTQLADMAEIEGDILKLGYQIVAVSPDDFPNLEATIEKNKVNYQLYSDKNSDVIKALGIGFKASEKSVNYIKKVTKGTPTQILPVPAVFILDEKGEILMEYIKPNYS
jgi:peroxiredoxin